MTLVEFLSGYAAIVSTAIAAVHWVKYFQERAGVAVSCNIGSVYSLAGRKPQAITPPGLAFYVTNTGAKSLVITHVGGLRPKNRAGTARAFFITQPDVQLPKRLEPADSFMMHTSAMVLDGEIEFLGAWDSVNRIWKVPKKTLAHARRQLADVRAKGELPPAKKEVS